MALRVATLNAWLLPGPLGPDADVRIRAIGEELRALAVDVAALQEVWTSPARRALVEEARRAGLPHVWQPSAWIGGGGLLLLSRAPIEGAVFEPFVLRGRAERVDHGEYWSGKGFLRAHLAFPQGRVAFVATHLHARYSRDAAHHYRPHRVAQLIQLVRGALRTHDPVVLAGDLNFEEGDPDYRVFRGLSGMRDVAAELDRREPTVLDTNPYRLDRRLPDRRIDFLCVRDGEARGLAPLEVRRAFDSPLEVAGRTLACSDHAGLVAELALAATPRPAPPPDPEAAELARALLAAGRTSERERARDHRLTGAASLALVLGGAGLARVTRRRFLQRAFRGAAAAALLPATTCSLLSEHYAPDEIHAFDEAEAALARLFAAERSGAPYASTG